MFVFEIHFELSENSKDFSKIFGYVTTVKYDYIINKCEYVEIIGNFIILN